MRTPVGSLLLLLLLVPASAQRQNPSGRSLVFTNAAVVDVRRGQLHAGMTIVVAENRITALGNAASVRYPTDAQVINAKGKYLIPGLWDMHVHVDTWELPLLVANGVTGIREMGSDCHPAWNPSDCLGWTRNLQQQIATGETLGPQLLALSSWGVFERSRWPNPPRVASELPPFFAPSTAQQGQQLARHFANQRVDFIKIAGHLPREGFLGLADEARRLGLSVAGHEQLEASAIEASDKKMKSVEHARVFLFNCFPDAKEFARSGLNDPDTQWRRRMVDEYDSKTCQKVFRAFARNDTRYVPTHLTRKTEAFADNPTFRQDERSKYIPKARWNDWNRATDAMVKRNPSPEARKALMDFYTKGLEITGAAHRAGVKIMLGTDTADNYVFPGFAVHDELRELVTAGLSPAEALKTATWNGAEFLGRTSHAGSIEKGKLANFILLDANPLTDIRSTAKIAAVVLTGRYLDRSALDQLLSAAEESARR
jgi:hypothetical protein